ncbi:NAD/NADP octopine/nopaline dehydrogenase family protein [Anaerotruncus rubiinfantis]|uniref:NAD/NADP octopine/nopaline dehydrogenase family protein n=1 Tax=Anaerotruncus rubiinfantis TaxID=1720200 RepID=UPI0034A59A6B
MDIQALKAKPIAILGAGGVGKPIAGDSALAGAHVRIWDQPEFAKKTLANIEKFGIRIEGLQMNMYSYQRSGFGYPEMVSDDLAKVVAGAGIVIVAVVASAHEKLFGQLIPLLEDGQVIHIIPDNFGTLLLRKMMREAGCDKKVIIGGWATSPYGARVRSEGGFTTNICDIRDRVIMLRGAALPDTDSEEFIESAKAIPAFDLITNGLGYQHADTVLDTCFSNANPVIHIPGTILGAAVMQNYETVLGHKLADFSMYAHCLCPAIAMVAADFWHEQECIAEAMQVGIAPVKREEYFSRSTMYGHEYMGPDYAVPFEENIPHKYGDGPTSLESRYITEDVPIGCYMYQQLARKYQVATPTIDAMIHLANTMMGRDLTENGYTLDYVGIGQMTHKQLQGWLREGVYTLM